MPPSMRSYHNPSDYQKVSDFLNRHHQPGNRDGNWLQPAWEYMHSHPNLDRSALDRIGLWEDGGELAAVVNYESTLGEAFFQTHPDYADLKPEMLEYAEKHLCGTNDRREQFLQVFVNDFDADFEQVVRERGYHRVEDCDRPMSALPIPDPFPPISVPDGYRLTSLAEDNDLRKINQVLWRGFNHPGEAPDDILPGRKQMQSGPNFRHDLNIAAVAPDGSYAAYAGTWFEPVNRYAYVEPVATDPQYRRLGLGKSAVLEGLRRCGLLGAHTAYVASEQEFYKAIGFKLIFTACCWEKIFG